MSGGCALKVRTPRRAWWSVLFRSELCGRSHCSEKEGAGRGGSLRRGLQHRGSEWNTSRLGLHTTAAPLT
jgi:hypothetical protein